MCLFVLSFFYDRREGRPTPQWRNNVLSNYLACLRMNLEASERDLQKVKG